MRNPSLQEIDDLIEKRNLKKAEVQLARYLREDLKPAERADTLLVRARARLLSGRADDALLELQEALDLVPELAAAPGFLELRGDCHLARFELASFGFADRADTRQAASDYASLLVLAPNWPNRGWTSYQQARIRLSENDMDGAMGYLQNALLSPGTLPALTAYCYERLSYIAFFDARNLTDALAYIGRAIATYPADHPRIWLSEVYTLRSRILRASHAYTQALESADTALKIASGCGPGGREALADAAQFAAEVAADMPGRERDVINYVEQFSSASRRPVGIDVAWSRAQELLGSAYLRAGLAAEALEAYQAALRHNPLHPEELTLYFQIARCYYQLEDYRRAANAVHVILRSADDDEPIRRNFRVHALLGNALYALGDYANAVNAYRAALLHAPAHADGLDGLQRYYQDALERSE